MNQSSLEEILDGHALALAVEFHDEAFIRENAVLLRDIAQACRGETRQDTEWNIGRAYASLPEYLVPNHAELLVALARQYNERTFVAYTFLQWLGKKTGSYCMENRVAKNLTPERVDFLFQLEQEQGINYFERYLRNDFPLWNCALASVARKSPKKPLAVVIHTKYDHNGTFSSTTFTYYKQLCQLFPNYAVSLFETDNRTEAFEQIKRAASYHRKRPRKIDLLVLGGHGNPWSLNLGCNSGMDIESLEQEAEWYLSILDGARFAEIAPYIGKKGKIVLVSCSTGANREGEKNLAQVISENIPQATVYAPKVDTHLKELQFEQGQLVDVVYYCEPTERIKLTAGRRHTENQNNVGTP